MKAAAGANTRESPHDLLLAPGQYAVRGADFRIRTMLGSCVSITLWEPRQRVGAMSHFLLAGRGQKPGASLDARYGAEALELMLIGLARLGVSGAQCEAKIFGGGNMFPNQTAPGALHVGQRNGESARALLQAHGIAVHSESLFGAGHRQIVFEVGTGDVWSRQVQPATGFGTLEIP